MRLVLLKKNYPPCFAGEKAGYPDEIADRLIADGSAYALDEEGNPVVPAEEAEQVAVKSKKSKRSSAKAESPAAATGSTGEAGDKDQLKFNPFTVDGLDEKLVAALAKANITTPEALREFIASEKPLTDIDGVTEVYASQLLELYSE